MAIRITVINNVDVPKNVRKMNDDSLWTFAANEWHRLISPFTPMDTGQLDTNVSIKPKEIHYRVPYAHYIYVNNFNFRKDKHPLATKEWDKAAIPSQGSKLVSAMQSYVDSGKLRLRG